MDCSLPGSSVHGDSQGKNTGVGCHSLLQEIFPLAGIKPMSLCLLYWQVGSLPLAVYLFTLFKILFLYRLLQDIEDSSLCCTLGPCVLTVLYIVVCVC